MTGDTRNDGGTLGGSQKVHSNNSMKILPNSNSDFLLFSVRQAPDLGPMSLGDYRDVATTSRRRCRAA